ncbi:MAG: hypothetical protein ACR2OB_10265 [Solirubrobacteraceae bacterium]
MSRTYPAVILIACAALLVSGGTALAAGLVKRDLQLQYVSLAHAARASFREARDVSLTPMPPVPLPHRQAVQPESAPPPSRSSTTRASERRSPSSRSSTAPSSRLPRTGTNVALEAAIAIGLLMVGMTLRIRVARLRTRYSAVSAGSAYRR